ncbi:MAG: hypothetical protein M3O46_08275 [Myxococcota bacterium]|nr:hypothetical protein [Myxococcota bacterium]
MDGSEGSRSPTANDASRDEHGFDYSWVVLDEGNPACRTDVCLINHFRGRTTCAYGQDANGNSPPGVPACTVPAAGCQ